MNESSSIDIKTQALLARTAAVAKTRVLICTHMGVAVPLTFLLCILDINTLEAVRWIHPQYPNMMALQSYMPSAPVSLFHSIGVVGWMIVFVLFAIGALVGRKRQNVLASAFVAHFLLMLTGLFFYCMCLMTVAATLNRLGPGGP
jgi:hypothetical protein